MFELVQHSYGKIFSRNVAFSFGIGEKFVFAYSENTGALAGAVLAAGALASARLWLGCHTIRQVAAGYVGGFIVATLAVLLL